MHREAKSKRGLIKLIHLTYPTKPNISNDHFEKLAEALEDDIQSQFFYLCRTTPFISSMGIQLFHEFLPPLALHSASGHTGSILRPRLILSYTIRGSIILHILNIHEYKSKNISVIKLGTNLSFKFYKTHVCGVTRSESVRRWRVDGFNSRPKPRHS